MPRIPSEQKVRYGIYHTPKQFLSMAEGVKHPMDTTEHLEGVTKWALDFVFRYPPHVVKLERRKNLLQAKLLATKMMDEEKALHEGLPWPVKKVLEGKNLLLWKALLERYEYDDLAVTSCMMEGVKLVGMPDSPPCYPAMLRPATLVLEDLQASAKWRRKAVVGKINKTDPTHVEHLETTALGGTAAWIHGGPLFQ